MSKEKIIDKQFLLILNGPSCGGKSAVSDIIFETYGSIYKAKSDAIKWLISDYDANLHRGVVHIMTFETMRVALSHGLSVMKEGGSWEPEKYVALAGMAHVPLFIANVEAPWAVLAARFEARKEAKKQGAKISNTDPKRFKELYDMYIDTKMKTELEFDSSTQSPEEIAGKIVFYIRTH